MPDFTAGHFVCDYFSFNTLGCSASQTGIHHLSTYEYIGSNYYFYNLVQSYAIFLKPVSSRRFFISENYGCIEFGGSGSMPFREHVIVFADGVDQIIEGLDMHLHVRQEHHFQGLERAYDLQLERLAISQKVESMVAPYLHLLLREVRLCERVLYLYQAVMECLVLCPEVLPYGEPPAEGKIGEQRGGEILPLCGLLPISQQGQSWEQEVDGLVALRFERGQQPVDTLL